VPPGKLVFRGNQEKPELRNFYDSGWTLLNLLKVCKDIFVSWAKEPMKIRGES
jgi:hypothetical protein